MEGCGVWCKGSTQKVTRDTVKDARADGDEIIGKVVIGVMQSRMAVTGPQKQHGGAGAVAEAPEILGRAPWKAGGVTRDLQRVERGGCDGGGLRVIFAVQEDVVIGMGEAKAMGVTGRFQQV